MSTTLADKTTTTESDDRKPGEGLPEVIAEILGVPVEQLRPLPRVA